MRKTFFIMTPLLAKVFFLMVSLVCISMPVSAGSASDKNAEIVKKEAEQNTQFLLAHVLRKAKSLQDVYGDFSPYGAALFEDGKVRYIWLAKPGEMIADPQKAIPVIRQTLRTQADAGRVLSTAVVYKYGRADDLQINAELEYISGYAVVVGTKVSIDNEQGLVLGEASMKPYDARVFVNDKKEEKPEE